jgi:hypothetical protein
MFTSELKLHEGRLGSTVCVIQSIEPEYIVFFFSFSFLVLGSNPGPRACYASAVPPSYITEYIVE